MAQSKGKADFDALTGASKFEERVSQRDSITLGAARNYAANLPQDKKGGLTGCYKIRCTKNATCCPGKVVGYACPAICCGSCAWTPGFFFGLDFCIGMCLCAAEDFENPGSYISYDNRGNFFGTVKVDAKSGTWAWFTAFTMGEEAPPDLENCIYCEPW